MSRTRLTDDAVAPVIAAMLLLAAFATFFAVWNSVAIPSMKAESEVNHLHGVEQSFTRFSAGLANAAAQRQEIQFEEPVILGGGSVIFNSLTSSGTLRVNPEPEWIYRIVIKDGATETVEEGRLVNFSYHPVGNFWQDQGYIWHYGFVNVTKYSGGPGVDNAVMSSPLNFPTAEDALRSPGVKKFASSLVLADSRPWYNSSFNCSSMTISAVTFSPSGDRDFASSNGIGMLAFSVSQDETTSGSTGESSPEYLLLQVNRQVPEPFAVDLYETANRSFEKLAGTYPGNIAHNFRTTPEFNETGIQPITGRLPLTITKLVVSVNVTAF